MAYYSGQASSYQELLNVLVAACQDQGWIWSAPVLSNNGCYLKVEVANVGAYSNSQQVIRLVAGNGATGATLQDTAQVGHALGTTIQNTNYGISFPVEYALHIHAQPNEVYLIVKYNINYFQWLAFGNSTSADNSLRNWAGGSFGVPVSGGYEYPHTRWPFVVIFPTGGGGGNQDGPCAAPFWNTDFPSYLTPKNYTSTIHNGSEWIHTATAVKSLAPLIDRNISSFFQEAALLPILPTYTVASNKTIVIAQIAHARYLRIDNYEPGQILTLGNERWKIYPFYKKDSTNRNGGNYYGGDDTGTFGWAIRYDGP